MATAKSFLPEGIRSLTPMLAVKNSLQAIEWYKRVFGAETRYISPGALPGSTVHAEIRIGDSSVYLADDSPMASVKSPTLLGGASASLTVYVPESDVIFERAVAAGAEVVMPIGDVFWGDRYGVIRDPFGCVWSIATHKEDLSAVEIDRRAREFFAAASKPGRP